MISVSETNHKIVELHIHNKIEELSNLHFDLQKERMKLDKFMTQFLDKFERKMNYEETDTPVWNLYRKKMNDYSKLSQLINTANYYLKKNNV